MIETGPGIGEILLAAIGTIALTVLGHYLRTRYPQLLAPPVKTVISELPKSDVNLSQRKDELSLTLAQGVLRRAEVIERLLVQSMAMNDQYQDRVNELEDAAEDDQLVIVELKRRLERCEELQRGEK